MRNKVLIVIMAIVWVGDVARARAQGTDQPSQADIDKAKAHYQAAEAHKKDGDDLVAKGQADAAREAYGRAVEEYIAGYKLSKRSRFLYNLGTVYGLRGDKLWAHRCYQSFLDTKPENPQDVEDTRTRMDELKREIEAQPGSASLPGDASLDPTEVCAVEEPGVTPVKATVPDTTEPEPVPPGVDNLGEDQPDPVRPGRGYRIAFWPSAGVTAVSAAVAVITFLQVTSLEDETSSEIVETGATLDPSDPCGDPGVSNYPSVKDLCDQGTSRAMLSNVFQGITLVGVVASGFLFYKGYMSPGRAMDPAPSGAQVTPVIGPSAVGAEVLWRF